MGLKHCIIRHLLFIHAFSKYLLSPFLGPGTFLGARSRKCLPSWDFIPMRVERDNTLRKNDTGREKRSAGAFAILIESSELALLSKKTERTMCPSEGRALQQEGTARVKLLWWEHALAHSRNSVVGRGAGTEPAGGT